MLQNRPACCAVGIDSGITNTGVGIVTQEDVVLCATVLCPPHDLAVLPRIHWLYVHLSALVHQYNPVVIGIETYTAPTVKVRAISAAAAAWHHWLIGACTILGRENTPAPAMMLLEAKAWMHQLSGIPMASAIGGKEVLEAIVECRTGYLFTHNSGCHKSDAVGIALVALDNWSFTRAAREEQGARR